MSLSCISSCNLIKVWSILCSVTILFNSNCPRLHHSFVYIVPWLSFTKWCRFVCILVYLFLPSPFHNSLLHIFLILLFFLLSFYFSFLSVLLQCVHSTFAPLPIYFMFKFCSWSWTSLPHPTSIHTHCESFLHQLWPSIHCHTFVYEGHAK